MPRTTKGEATRAGAWLVAYWILMLAILLTAVLNLARVSGGFLTNHLADVTVPALLYVLAREFAPRKRLALPALTAWLGRSPERAAAVLLLSSIATEINQASIATEINQAIWPRGLFAGRFDCPFAVFSHS